VVDETPALPGLRIGHWQDEVGITGCTVLLPIAGIMSAGVSIDGGAPGTRETALLAPTATVSEIHALVLTGGSAFGLDAAGGVMAFLRERGLGFATPVARVPIVPAAVLFDLDIGDATAFPSAAAGAAACAAATEGERREGCVGAGYGACVGRVLGRGGRTKGGLGLASHTLANGVTLGALAVVNAVGDVIDVDGTVIAGTRRDRTYVGSTALLRGDAPTAAAPGLNTTLVAVVTDAKLDKTALTRLARQAQDGLVRAITPVHTAFDGDAVFALSTSSREADPVVLGVLAVEVTAAAIRRAVRAAVSLGGVPAASDLQATTT